MWKSRYSGWTRCAVSSRRSSPLCSPMISPSRASMIWIVGEYAERIDNADELLEGFLDSFKDESSQVQLQLLTAIVKLFLKKPSTNPQTLVTRVLTMVTQVSDSSPGGGEKMKKCLTMPRRQTIQIYVIEGISIGVFYRRIRELRKKSSWPRNHWYPKKRIF